MKPIYIIDGVRTPIGAFLGSLAACSAAQLGSEVVMALMKQNAIRVDAVDEVVMGNVLQAGLGQNVARQIQLASGIPQEKTAMTVNMVCGSGLRAVCLAAQAIKAEDASLIIAGGTESMSNAPYLLPQARTGYRMGHGALVDSIVYDGLWDVFNQYHMGVTAENLADSYSISRDAQDRFACDSQNKTECAQAAGKFDDEIIPVLIPQRKGDPLIVKTDEFPRKGVIIDQLAKLKPAFKPNGTVTAGNSSGINDGAAVVAIAGEAAVTQYHLKPKARIVSYAWHGTDPKIMGIGPVEAVWKALSRARWKIKDLDLIEANEAFAVQSLAVAKELGWPMDKVNVNGGAIALGHPIGASGARILVSLIHEMNRRQVKRGLATLCIGGGMGIAMCVEML